MTIVIDTPDGIEFYQLCAMRGRLKLEIDTGLRFRVSTLAAVNRKFGTKHRTKKAALTYIEAKIKEKQL